MPKLRVGVLRGGPSSEYQVSLKSGETVLKHLPEHYSGLDIFIDREGVWHFHGFPKKPQEILPMADVFFNALHGEYGEDGQVQKFLDHHRVPYTGSKSLASVLSMNKVLTKKILSEHGIKTPYYTVVSADRSPEEIASELHRGFHLPVVVKPVGLGSSVGVSLAKSIFELEVALEKVFRLSGEALIEEYINGKEATCGVVDEFRGHRFYALPPVEIRKPRDADFFDYESKYGGKSQEICPGNFLPEEKRGLERLAIEAHKLLGLRHYSRTDFIVHPKRGIYFLEINSLPGLTAESLMPKALGAIGTPLPEFLDHLVKLALAK